MKTTCQVRFSNESFFEAFKVDLSEVVIDNVFNDEVFAHIQDCYFSIKRTKTINKKLNL